jgi:His-Xaa-Ser system protein HxsD
MSDVKSGRELVFETAVYSREAVDLAVYVFSGKYDVSVFPGKKATRVMVNGTASPEIPAGELANEVLNQQCRLDLGKKNSRIAGIIVTKALLSACGEKIKAKTGKK